MHIHLRFQLGNLAVYFGQGRFVAFSKLLYPAGEVLADAGDEPGVTFAEPPQDGKAMFKSRSKKTEEMERFGKCYEMDVAYTL
jgi:hypothetical protein